MYIIVAFVTSDLSSMFTKSFLSSKLYKYQTIFSYSIFILFSPEFLNILSSWPLFDFGVMHKVIFKIFSC